MSVTPQTSFVRALVQTLPGSILRGSDDGVVSGIAHDSRLVMPGDLFAALRGADLDGHNFVKDAEHRGAVALLVERRVESSLPQIVVSDSRAALAAVSAAHYRHPSRAVNVIGVTGTDGKTTTTYLVDHILRSAGLRTGLIGTVAIRIGEQEDRHPTRQTTPESNDIQRYLRKMVDAEANWAILEATSHGLAMHRLDHVRFRIAAITNITHEHLDFHGSIDNYRRAKARLLEQVGSDAGLAVINNDDPGARAILPFAAGATVMTYGTAGRVADIRASGVRSSASGSEFDLDAGESGCVPVTLPLIGEFNVANAVCASCVALAAGVDLEMIGAALASAPAVPGRMARVECGQPFTVIVDYAHTPDSLGKVLTLLRDLHPGGKLIAVFGSAGERDREKRPRQGAASARLADISIITSEDPRFERADTIINEIAAGAQVAGATPGRTLFCRTDRREAIELALELAGPGDCVLLAGKGHEGSIIWGRDKLPWDEAAVARELLRAAGYAALDR